MPITEQQLLQILPNAARQAAGFTPSEWADRKRQEPASDQYSTQ